MNIRTTRAFLATVALGAACSAWGCVADRPARNGVFNENQYLRKAFIIQPGDGTGSDPGWMLNAAITQVSTPNPLFQFGVWPGAIASGPSQNGGSLVRFAVTSDHLQMIDMRQIAQDPSAENTITPSVLNAWPATNVDLKYEVNLDGEKTNFYSENQELDWQVRQWVKLSFDKNDMSDLSPFGSTFAELLAKCTDASSYSTTLVPGSFVVDEPNNYMEWSVQITMPINWTDSTCVNQYGELGVEANPTGPTASIPRQTETITLKYSMVRANPAPTYQPLIVGEKDPIRHKYRTFEMIAENRDPSSGLLAAQQMVMRFDPNKPIVWYFTPGFPPEFMTAFTCTGTVPGSSPPQAMSDLCTKYGVDESLSREAETNQIFQDAGAAARLRFLNYNDRDTLGDGLGPARAFGDVRYSFLQWVSDQDTQQIWSGLTQFVTDPRTGETLSADITINDEALKTVAVQIDAYLQSIGASLNINSAGQWASPAGTCKAGQTMPIVPATVASNHNGTDSLYNKIQLYLQRDPATYGNLGPEDFIVTQDQDFFNAYYKLLPYEVYQDPDTNPFVVREGGQGVLGAANMWTLMQQEAAFQTLSTSIDHGDVPYDGSDDGMAGYQNAVGFLSNYQSLSQGHRQYSYLQGMLGHGLAMDSPTAFSLESIVLHDARQCVLDDASNPGAGTHWQTKDEWENQFVHTYWTQTMTHEFGHSLGMRHNFMGSLDQFNFPTYTDAAGASHIALYSNSVMEYNATPSDIYWHQTWGMQDRGNIAWIYGNARGPSDLGAGLGGTNGPYGAAGSGITGQASPAAPWRDTYGFCTQADVAAKNPQCGSVANEKVFLQCTDEDVKYTPFCRQGDTGTTPSAIIASQIDTYEWRYAWRNFRAYNKIWDNSAYANGPIAMMTDMRRFLSTWLYDWGASDLVNNFRRLGISDPDPNGAAVEYYTQLTNKFTADVSMANQLVAAFATAVINESSGDRPYRTIYDPFYGDVTQQGIVLDKLDAMQSFVGLWPTENYDQNQAGNYVSSYGAADTIGDPAYLAVAQATVNSMVGGQYDIYPYALPLAVTQFATATHSPAFPQSSASHVRNWIGGQVFTRLDDFLSYFRDLAAQNNVPGCPTFDAPTCTYDPRTLSDTHNQFFGPDDKEWIWAYVPDRNQWVVAQKEYNTATYVVVRNYTDDVVFQLDDGNEPGHAFGAELPMKYFLDYFQAAN